MSTPRRPIPYTVEFGPDPAKYDNVIRRISIRGVAYENGKYLMISTNRGDLFFPGGTPERGETDEATLFREIREETGYECCDSARFLGTILYRRPDRFRPGALFEMEARYYSITVDPRRKNQELTETEKGLDLKAFWMKEQELRRQNTTYLKEKADDPFWPRQVDYILNPPD